MIYVTIYLDILFMISGERNLEGDSGLPLYSLNDFNQRKLCATIMNISLPKIADVPLENKFILHSVFEENKFSYLDFSVVCLKCIFQSHLFKNTIFYIAQLPNQENRVIILGDNTINVYDIREFETESNSLG